MIANVGWIDSMRRAYSYIRFSSVKQRRGDSHRRQMAFAGRVCKDNGWLLDDSLRLHDVGVSAYRSKNAKVGALAEFLHAVESGRVAAGSALILENIDRLSRNKVGDALQLFIRILNHGITIVTAEPERTYTRESINDVAALLEPIIYMSRAYDESRTKAMRSRAVWGRKKELAATEGKPLGIPPVAWIELTTDGYRLIPDRAATVRAIFRMAATEGLGKLRIVQALRADPKRYPPFGISKQWNTRYVDLILNNRAAFGEYQRYSADPETGVRLKEGEPVKGFYPAAITEQDFYSARAAMARRKQRSGRPAKHEYNLFTGIVFNAVDKQSMHVRTVRRKENYLTTRAVWRGAKWDKSGPFATSFNIAGFESAVLSAVSELTPADLQDKGQSPDAQAEAIRSETDALIALDHKLSTLKAKAADPKTKPAALPAILEMVESTAQAKHETAARLEQLKADAMSGRPETLGETQSLIKLLADAKGKEAETLRRRLKSRLRLLIDGIWVVIQRLDGRLRAAHIQLHMRGGATKYILAFSPKQPTPTAYERAMNKFALLPLWNVDFRTLDPNDKHGPLEGYVKFDADVLKALERFIWKPGSR